MLIFSFVFHQANLGNIVSGFVFGVAISETFSCYGDIPIRNEYAKLMFSTKLYCSVSKAPESSTSFLTDRLMMMITMIRVNTEK